ncbi:hypothetical protein [Algoriphagus machipongonensis]|uniref:Outer membrane protein beta-barrel domain-containing protein n=1 Tax=Algoriphagus machipongonensis TaxID=388413 RepID=A3HTZ7_9BACT|nr:hypothetical protein [Algoriphagus machipongonensis]EAZ81619.1 hypothetical protein ALPR1_00220 [Algoriphagus machipongonensis]
MEKLQLRILFLILFLTSPHLVKSQFRLNLESGAAFSQYNDVRVPNGDSNAGTLFSLQDDFKTQPTAFFRLEMSYLINDKHTIELTAAPLQIGYQDSQLEEINFAEILFSGEGIDGTYQFNTYRASYRYRLVDNDQWILDLGATILARDARIALTQGELQAEDTDLGFVPLVSFNLNYTPKDKLSLVLKGDALVGPQGRAEDIFAGIQYPVWKPGLQLKAGYRLIEGGADVDQVYNFAYIHFASVGLVYDFSFN